MQPQVISDLTSAPRTTIECMAFEDIPIAKHLDLIRESATIGSNFNEIMLKFADIHHGINHCNSITDGSLHRIGNILGSYFGAT